MLVLREEPVHRPGEWKNVLDLRLVAVGRIDTQQFLAGKRQDAVVVHRGAARLAWMVDGAAQGERVAIEIDELNPARVAVREISLKRQQNQMLVRHHVEGFFIGVRLAPGIIFAQRDFAQQRGCAWVMDVEERHCHAPTVRAVEADGHKPVPQRLDIIRVAGHLDFAGDFWMRRVGNIHYPQRIDAPESDDINETAVEARGVKALAVAQRHLSQLEHPFRSDSARIGQMKRFKLCRPRGVAVDRRFGNGGKNEIRPVHLELVVHAARGGNRSDFTHRAIRCGDVEAVDNRAPVIGRGGDNDEQEDVRGRDDVIISGIPNGVFGDGRFGIAQVKRGNQRTGFPRH